MRSGERLVDYYAVLGVSAGASREAIFKAYRRSVKAAHPDTNPGKAGPAAGRRISELVEAWKVLGNRSTRAAYDAERGNCLGGRAAHQESAETGQEASGPKAQTSSPTWVSRCPSPRLGVRPGSFRVRRCECAGAPRSLVMNLLVLNEGDGSLAGYIEASPWVRFVPQSFGLVGQGSKAVPVSVEVRCQEWEQAGWRPGVVRVVAEGGDVRDVVLVADVESSNRELFRVLSASMWWALPAVSLWPLLALVMGLPWLAAAPAVLSGLAIPRLMEGARCWETKLHGDRRRAEGWRCGPSSDSNRLVLVVMAWAVLGGILGANSGRELGWLLLGSASAWMGAGAGVVAGLSVSARDGLLHSVARGTGGLQPYCPSIAGVVVGLAWALLSALSAELALGGLARGAAAWGGAVGWLIGNLVVHARSQALRQDWRRGIAGVVGELIPVGAGWIGFSAAVVLAVDGVVGAGWLSGTTMTMPRPAATGSGALVALPMASLSAALVGAASCAGVAAGFALGLFSLVPELRLTASRPVGLGSLSDWLGWCRAVALDTLKSYAGIDEMRAVAADSQEPAWLGMQQPRRLWGVVLAGGVMALLTIYSLGHLLLALSATVGILVS